MYWNVNDLSLSMDHNIDGLCECANRRMESSEMWTLFKYMPTFLHLHSTESCGNTSAYWENINTAEK